MCRINHTEPALHYIRVMWRMVKLYHLRAYQARRDRGDMPDMRADIQMLAYEAAHEANGEFVFFIAQEKTREFVRRWFRYSELFAETPDFRGRRDCPKKLAPILAYYELDTFEGTCAKFGLKPTHALRKLFSACCPKPELGKQNGTWHNHAERVQVEPEWTAQYIAEAFGVSIPTAYRSMNRGYFYKPAARVGNLENLFSAKEIMNALLNSEHRDEIIATLQVSETYSFYFTVEGVRYRVSNHAPRHWSLRLGEPEWIDVSPAAPPENKDKLLNLLISSPQNTTQC